MLWTYIDGYSLIELVYRIKLNSLSYMARTYSLWFTLHWKIGLYNSNPAGVMKRSPWWKITPIFLNYLVLRESTSENLIWNINLDGPASLTLSSPYWVGDWEHLALFSFITSAYVPPHHHRLLCLCSHYFRYEYPWFGLPPAAALQLPITSCA